MRKRSGFAYSLTRSPTVALEEEERRWSGHILVEGRKTGQRRVFLQDFYSKIVVCKVLKYEVISIFTKIHKGSGASSAYIVNTPVGRTCNMYDGIQKCIQNF